MFRLFLKATITSLLIICLNASMQMVVADTQIGFQNQKKQFFIFSPDGKYLAKVYSTDRKTRVRIHETADMALLTEWEIPDFEVHTARFSSDSPDKLLLADKKRLFVYRLIDDKQKLVFFQPKIKGQEIIQAYFESPNDEVVWATRSTLYKTDTDNKQQDKILTIPWEKGSIDQITGLSSGEYAVSLTDSNRVLLLDSKTNKQPVELIGHRS